MTGLLDLVLRACRLPDGRQADTGCRDGFITEIGDLAGRAATRGVDCAGGAVTPGLVEAHIHLDKALLSDRAPSSEGTLQSPGTEALLRPVLREGADLVGGCPYDDTDGRARVDIVFALARESGVEADFHADFSDEPEPLHVRDIAAETVRHGWQGRVAVGHCTELAAPPPAEQDAIAATLKGAEIGILMPPATISATPPPPLAMRRWL